jgi:hypothetical protein
MGEILLYFFVAMETDFDGTDQENSYLCIFAARKKLNKGQLVFSSASITPTFDDTLTNWVINCRLARPTITTGQRTVSPQFIVQLHCPLTPSDGTDHL